MVTIDVFIWQEIILLQAILATKKGADQESVVALLKEATELHFQTLQGLPHGVEYLQRLNLSFLLQVVSMHLADSQVFLFLFLLFSRMANPFRYLYSL